MSSDLSREQYDHNNQDGDRGADPDPRNNLSRTAVHGLAGTVRDFACLSQSVVTLRDSSCLSSPLIRREHRGTHRHSAPGERSSWPKYFMHRSVGAGIEGRTVNRFVPFALGGNVVSRGFAVSDLPRDTGSYVTHKLNVCLAKGSTSGIHF